MTTSSSSASLTGTITLGAEITVSETTRIFGPGANVLSVSGNNTSRIFNVDPDSGDAVYISDLTLMDGSTTGSGGAIRNEDADFTMFDSTLSGNDAGTDGSGYGGAFYERGGYASGTYTYIGYSTFTNNTSGGVSTNYYGGGGALYGYLTLGSVWDFDDL